MNIAPKKATKIQLHYLNHQHEIINFHLTKYNVVIWRTILIKTKRHWLKNGVLGLHILVAHKTRWRYMSTLMFDHRIIKKFRIIFIYFAFGLYNKTRTCMCLSQTITYVPVNVKIDG